MKQTGTDVNRMVLHGRAAPPPAISPRNPEVEFFSFPLVVSRLSGVSDRLNIMASRPLLERCRWIEEGEELTVWGEVRVKICRLPEGVRCYPEYEDVASLCRDHGIAYPDVYQEVLRECGDCYGGL